jgi:hypothetical protein
MLLLDTHSVAPDARSSIPAAVIGQLYISTDRFAKKPLLYKKENSMVEYVNNGDVSSLNKN